MKHISIHSLSLIRQAVHDFALPSHSSTLSQQLPSSFIPSSPAQFAVSLPTDNNTDTDGSWSPSSSWFVRFDEQVVEVRQRRFAEKSVLASLFVKDLVDIVKAENAQANKNSNPLNGVEEDDEENLELAFCGVTPVIIDDVEYLLLCLRKTNVSNQFLLWLWSPFTMLSYPLPFDISLPLSTFHVTKPIFIKSSNGESFPAHILLLGTTDGRIIAQTLTPPSQNEDGLLNVLKASSEYRVKSNSTSKKGNSAVITHISSFVPDAGSPKILVGTASGYATVLKLKGAIGEDLVSAAEFVTTENVPIYRMTLVPGGSMIIAQSHLQGMSSPLEINPPTVSVYALPPNTKSATPIKPSATLPLDNESRSATYLTTCTFEPSNHTLYLSSHTPGSYNAKGRMDLFVLRIGKEAIEPVYFSTFTEQVDRTIQSRICDIVPSKGDLSEGIEFLVLLFDRIVGCRGDGDEDGRVISSEVQKQCDWNAWFSDKIMTEESFAKAYSQLKKPFKSNYVVQSLLLNHVSSSTKKFTYPPTRLTSLQDFFQTTLLNSSTPIPMRLRQYVAYYFLLDLNTSLAADFAKQQHFSIGESVTLLGAWYLDHASESRIDIEDVLSYLLHPLFLDGFESVISGLDKISVLESVMKRLRETSIPATDLLNVFQMWMPKLQSPSQDSNSMIELTKMWLKCLLCVSYTAVLVQDAIELIRSVNESPNVVAELWKILLSHAFTVDKSLIKSLSQIPFTKQEEATYLKPYCMSSASVNVAKEFWCMYLFWNGRFGEVVRTGRGLVKEYPELASVRGIVEQVALALPPCLSVDVGVDVDNVVDVDEAENEVESVNENEMFVDEQEQVQVVVETQFKSPEPVIKRLSISKPKPVETIPQQQQQQQQQQPLQTPSKFFGNAQSEFTLQTKTPIQQQEKPTQPIQSSTTAPSPSITKPLPNMSPFANVSTVSNSATKRLSMNLSQPQSKSQSTPAPLPNPAIKSTISAATESAPESPRTRLRSRKAMQQLLQKSSLLLDDITDAENSNRVANTAAASPTRRGPVNKVSGMDSNSNTPSKKKKQVLVVKKTGGAQDGKVKVTRVVGSGVGVAPSTPVNSSADGPVTRARSVRR